MMSNLDELKQPYIELLTTSDVGDFSHLEIVDMYFAEQDSYKKDVYIATIILYCWPALERLYYKQNVKLLSVEDCYDIFMDSLQYVLDKRVWKNPSHSLYNDEDAILKSMYVVTESRRRNYFVAQNRQKRQVNQYPVSLDVLSDDFQEGFFYPVTESYNFSRGWEKGFIKNLWSEKRYVSAIVLDIILNLDVFDDDFIDKKKIKKYVKNFDEVCYNSFIQRYELPEDYTIFEKYLRDINDIVIYNYIDNALSMFKNNDVLKSIKEENAD